MRVPLDSRTLVSGVVAGAVLTLGAPAFSQAPFALVEAVHGSPGVEFMDYVVPGKVIKLKPRDTLVLGYLSSCWSETISGGTVMIGREQSEVQGGTVKREKVMCDGGRMELTAKQANQSAGTSLRAPDEDMQTIYGLSPFVEARGRAALLVVRLDKPTEYFTAVLTEKRGAQRSYHDFADVNVVLTPGKTYRASIGSRQIVFKIDPNAKPGRVPLISRLLRFGQTS